MEQLTRSLVLIAILSGAALPGCTKSHDVTGQVVDEDDKPIVNAVVALKYLYGPKFRLPDESLPAGRLWLRVVTSDVAGNYPIPKLPKDIVPGWRYGVDVSPEVYIAPSITQTVRESGILTVFEVDDSASIGSVAAYGEQPTPVVVKAKTVDLANEEQLMARILYVHYVFSAAPNPKTNSHHKPYHWSDTDIVKKAMYEEMAFICSYWKREYYPKNLQDSAPGLPLMCRDILGNIKTDT